MTKFVWKDWMVNFNKNNLNLQCNIKKIELFDIFV